MMRDFQHHHAANHIPGERSVAGLAAVEVMAGAAAGALTGALAGPPGAVIGAVLGGAVGAAASVAIDRGEHEKAIHEEELDRDIGVIGGDIGEASPNQPPPRYGMFHASVLGVEQPSEEPSDGPMQNVDAKTEE